MMHTSQLQRSATSATVSSFGTRPNELLAHVSARSIRRDSSRPPMFARPVQQHKNVVRFHAAIYTLHFTARVLICLCSYLAVARP